jgi:hypothetical protein
MQRPVHDGIRRILMNLSSLGPAEEAMCASLFAALARRREAADIVVPMLLRYAQIRHMYDHAGFWPTSAGTQAPARAH